MHIPKKYFKSTYTAEEVVGQIHKPLKTLPQEPIQEKDCDTCGNTGIDPVCRGCVGYDYWV